MERVVNWSGVKVGGYADDGLSNDMSNSRSKRSTAVDRAMHVLHARPSAVFQPKRLASILPFIEFVESAVQQN